MRTVPTAIVTFGAWIALATGCKHHDELKVDVACEDVCACGDPDEVAACEAECAEELAPARVSEACFQCLLEETSCDAIERRCRPVCDDSPPPENLP